MCGWRLIYTYALVLASNSSRIISVGSLSKATQSSIWRFARAGTISLIPNWIVLKNVLDVFHTDFKHVARCELEDTIMGHEIIDEKKSDRMIACYGEDIAFSVGN